MGNVDALYRVTPWIVENHVGVWTMPRFSAAIGIDLATCFDGNLEALPTIYA
jgi:hypothetical protein